MVWKKLTPCSTEVTSCNNKVASYCIKVVIEIFLSKYIHARSSFKDLITTIFTAKTDLNFDVWFKKYDLLIFVK